MSKTECPWHTYNGYEYECELEIENNCCDCSVGDLWEENVRLRKVLEEAYKEGYWDGVDGSRMPQSANDGWLNSKTREALK